MNDIENIIKILSDHIKENKRERESLIKRLHDLDIFIDENENLLPKLADDAYKLSII